VGDGRRLEPDRPDVGRVALFIACIGKSGQFPLHTWLPDAMAGPTPVSSLLHSSTMVVAGVFLVARLYPVFFNGFDIGVHGNTNVIAVIGGITIIIAAGLAFVQDDIKRVLAYSTVSQLGYMMMGLGVGAWTPAVFHIFTHAFFKCCLFLCAGSVSHSGSHHSFDMKKDMGGPRTQDADHDRHLARLDCGADAGSRSSAASSRRTRSSTTRTTTATRSSGSSASSAPG
jgi:NADH-quinone oxidoreductase subunit L